MLITKRLLFLGFILLTGNITGQVYVDSILANHDAQVYSGATTTNYGTNGTMNIKVSSSTLHYRSFVNFNLASMGIPSNAVIVYAYMSLRVNSETDISTGTTTYLKTATSSWSESTIDYSNQPSLSTTNQVTTCFLLYNRRTFDVTTLIQEAIANPSAFYGWGIHRNPETTNTSGNTYNTKEGVNQGSSPRLKISWYVPYSISAATITNASTTSATDGSVSPAVDDGSGSNTYLWKDASGSTVGTGSTLTGVGYGWYGLQVSGALSDVFYMAFLVGVDCEPVEIPFDPGPNYIDDSWLQSNTSSTNYGTMQSINASNILSGTYYTAKNLMRFRLWMDPSQNPIVADLNLTGRNHYTAVRSNISDLLQVTSDWGENTVTYGTIPTSSTSILETIPATSTSNENKVVDLTDFWNYWKIDNTLNYGVLMQLQLYNGTAARMQFASADTSHGASRPNITFLIDDGLCDRTNYVRFKKVVDGSYVETFEGQLKFYFNEEYQINSGKKIPLTLYDFNHDIVAAIDITGSAVGGNPLLPAIAYVIDDNRASLDLTSYSLTDGKFYLLELTHVTGEKEYIKFMYKD